MILVTNVIPIITACGTSKPKDLKAFGDRAAECGQGVKRKSERQCSQGNEALASLELQRCGHKHEKLKLCMYVTVCDWRKDKKAKSGRSRSSVHRGFLTPADWEGFMVGWHFSQAAEIFPSQGLCISTCVLLCLVDGNVWLLFRFYKRMNIFFYKDMIFGPQSWAPLADGTTHLCAVWDCQSPFESGLSFVLTHRATTS